jgi:hypothetical protein
MADKSEEKQTWWRTLPGILIAITGLLTAITGLAIGLNQVGLLGGHVSTATTPASTALAGLANSNQPPTGVPLIGLPAVSADWQGFPVPSYARCDGGDPAVVIAETTQSKLVICHGPNDLYYRGMGNNTTDGIELHGAVRASGATTSPTPTTTPNTKSAPTH